jgi:cytochrome c
MKFLYSLSLLLSTTLLTAQPLSDNQAIQKGAEVSRILVQKLGNELKTQMQSSGPIAALHFCSQNALSITEQVAKESSTSIKRVSIQNRNPINTPTTEEQLLLNQWDQLIKSGKQLPMYDYKKRTNGQNIYYKPIVINNETCLKCHGDVTVDLAKAIKEIYPEDKATGYKMGDLRGMAVISF